MTGIYNVRNYVKFEYLPPNETTVAQLLKNAGYATSIAGKWQLSVDRAVVRQSGFDEYCLWNVNSEEKTPRYNEPSGFIQNGKELPTKDGQYGPDVVSDFLLDFITRNKNRPFLCYYPMMLPHAPFEPTPDSPDRQSKIKSNNDIVSRVMKFFAKPERQTHYFPDMVAYLDKLVGKIVAHLDKLGLRENTLVLFTGDNGTNKSIRSMLGNKEVQGGKGLSTHAGTHVPLIVSWPKVVHKGKISSDLVDFTDFLPTLCEAAEAQVPPQLALDGQSFLPQLRGQRGHPRQWVYSWFSKNGKSERAIEFARNQRYKLYRTGDFYDIIDDDLERQSLPEEALDANAKKTRAMLQAALDKYRNARPDKLRTA